jgi:thiol:disulfide interchange protein DsbA
MRRRAFAMQWAWGLALPHLAWAQDAPREGLHFLAVSPPAPADLPPGHKAEVIEFFWYECPHCFDFDPAVEAWRARLPADVSFRRVPVGFTARHQASQKLFYALQVMGALDLMHPRVFSAIHLLHQRLLSEAEMAAFVAAQGIDGAKFTDTLRSFQVSTLATRARQLSDAYKCDAVPMLGVNGRWTTSGAHAGSNERSLAVVDFLIERQRRTR